MTAAPQVQCSTGPFWAFDLEQAMDALAAAGFTDIELMVTRDPRTQEPDLPLRLARERGLNIASVHGPFLVVTKGVWGTDPVIKIERGVEMCEAVGASSLIVHPPYLWETRYAHWITTELADYSAAHGVTIAVETMYPKWVAGRRLRLYRWLEPEQLVAACPHVALDTSHLTVGRFDLLRSYKVLAPRLVHIHLSNNAGDGRDGHLPLEQGILQIDRFLDNLRVADYSGAVSLELAVSSFVEKPQELTAMLKKNREFIEKRLGRPARRAKGLPRG
ncbi:MAG: sugar phosphate isomerase/epimerase family protein [Actinomycetota bacterium]